jgi:hypothetical protein
LKLVPLIGFFEPIVIPFAFSPAAMLQIDKGIVNGRRNWKADYH